MSERNMRQPNYLRPELWVLLEERVLERCTSDAEFISGRQAWRAPKGYSFSVTGRYNVFCDTSNEWEAVRPQPSRELFIGDNKEEYLRCLKESGGDPDKAIEVMVGEGDDVQHPWPHPDSFQGKWLIQEVDDYSQACLTVREPVQAEVVRERETYRANIGIDDKGLVFDVSEPNVYWCQHLVTISQGDEALISLVEVEENQDDNIYVPEPSDDAGLLLPTAVGITLEEYVGVLRKIGIEPLKGQLEAAKLGRRASGDPFSDDPLDGFVSLREIIVADNPLE